MTQHEKQTYIIAALVLFVCACVGVGLLLFGGIWYHYYGPKIDGGVIMFRIGGTNEFSD